jgi:phosphoglycolate phosphatase
MTSTTSTVLLDLDGTLTDPQVGITRSIRHALETLGLPVPSEVELLSFIGPPLQETFDTLFGDAAVTQRCLALYRERFSAVGLYENRVFAGVPEMLDALSAAGHRLVLATSKPHVFARRILDYFDLARHFSAIHGAEMDGTRAQKTALIAHILAAEGIIAETAVMVGDREHDVIGAGANGIATIGVLYGYGDVAELQAAGTAATVMTPGEIPAMVERLFADRRSEVRGSESQPAPDRRMV